jgi:hypothetical protein
MESLKVCRYEGKTQNPAIAGQDGCGEKQKYEPVMVPVANARVDKDAVVIGAGDTPLTHVAVLRARWLNNVTSAADTAWVK